MEDGIKAYVFPLAIGLRKGKKLAPGPVYLGLLFARLNECGNNILRSVGRYDVVTHTNTCFIQVLLSERFGGIALN